MERIQELMSSKKFDYTRLFPQYEQTRKKYFAMCAILISGILVLLSGAGLNLYLHSPGSKTGLFHSSDRYIAPLLEVTPEDYWLYKSPIEIGNATAIFNSVNSALSNKDNQILTNGISMIPAYIPKGTWLYHGNNYGEVPEGVGWIAFDHEFSYAFMSHFKGREDKTGGDRGNGAKGNGDMSKPESNPLARRGFGKGTEEFAGGIMPGGGNKKPAKDHSTLYSFEVVKPLDKVIFLDGATGSKGRKGQVDTQMILSHIDKDTTVDEYTAARKICEWGKPWGLDGIIRIEIGFEMILCDFQSDKIKVGSRVTLEHNKDLVGLPEPGTTGGDAFDGEYKEEIQNVMSLIYNVQKFDQIRSGTVHDKHDGRILLDFRGLVTPVNRTWISPNPWTRRTVNISEELKQTLVNDLGAYLSKGADPYTGTNWKLLTTEIEDKFTPIFQSLENSFNRIAEVNSDDQDTLLNEIANLTVSTSNFVRRFSDYDTTDNEEERRVAKRQAVYQYSHPLESLQTDSDVLIWSSITTVMEEIVDTIFEVFDVSKNFLVEGYLEKKNVDSLKPGLESISEKFYTLLDNLKWTTFYQCAEKCNSDSVCYTPWRGFSPDADNGKVSKDLKCATFRQ